MSAGLEPSFLLPFFSSSMSASLSASRSFFAGVIVENWEPSLGVSSVRLLPGQRSERFRVLGVEVLADGFVPRTLEAKYVV